MNKHPKLRAALDWGTILIVPACYILLGAIVLATVRGFIPGADSVDVTAGFDIVLTLCAVFVWKRVRTNRPKRKLSTKGEFAVIAFCAVMFLIAQCAATIVYSLTSDPTFASYRTAMSGGNAWLSIVLTVAIAPIVEELLFRGIMFDSLANRMPMWVAAIVSSIAFAATHCTIVHLLPATLMGLSCCAIYVLTGKIRNNIFVHAAYNTFSLVAPYMVVPSILFVPLVTIPITFGLGILCCAIIKNPDKWRDKLCVGNGSQAVALEMPHPED